MRHIFVLGMVSFLFFSCSRNKSLFHTNLKFEPAENLFLAKQFPDRVPNETMMKRAMDAASDMLHSGKRSDGQWTLQGPANIGARINTIAIHPSNNDIIFAGFADGGLWRTTNAGVDWLPVFDDQAYMSIGSICFDPNQPNTVYVGTGDPNVSGYPRAGGGIFKSTDMGDTWTYIGLKEARIVSRIAIHQSQPSTIYAATMGTPFIKNNNRGLYKSSDGGLTWQQKLFINDSTGISEVIIHPTNANRLYAIGWNRIRNNNKSLVSGPDARVYRSDNGGDSWEMLTNGLPQDNFTRMGICISESNPDVLYVQYTHAVNFNFEAIYMTTDGGDSWSLHSDKSIDNNFNMLGGFGWYFGQLRVNPEDENDLFLLGVGLYRYNSDEKRWLYVASQDLNDPHADKHDLLFRDGNMYLATDGGLYKANIYGSTLWQDIENIPTTQFYRTAYNPHKPDLYYGGAQDNGTSSGNQNGIADWNHMWGGDGFQMAFRPDDENVFYFETQNGRIVGTFDGGISFFNATDSLQGSRHWDMQYLISQHNADVLYTGTDKFYKSVAGIVPEFHPISGVLVNPSAPAIIHQFTTLSESPLDENILYCGTSDAMVWNTIDGGANWNLINDGLPYRYISSIKASPAAKNTVYVTLTGYKDNDNNPHIFKSTNNGKTWISIASNLPPLAINDVFIYPNGNDNVLFVATDGGVFFTVNSGNNWEILGNNLPLIPVFDLDYNLSKNELIAATFARGIQTFDLYQVNVSQETLVNETGDNSWSIQPVIATSVIEIVGKKQGEDIMVFDEKGRWIMKEAFRNQIDISALKPGIYFVKNGKEVKKIIKI